MAEGVVGELVSDRIAAVVADEGGKCAQKPALLIVIGELSSSDDIKHVSARIARELSVSWNAEVSHCDIKQCSRDLASCAPSVIDTETGGKTLEWKSEVIDIKVLVQQTVRSVQTAIEQFISVDSVYRYLLYSGNSIIGNGNWLLQDGSFSFQLLAELIHADTSTKGPIDVASFVEGDWSTGNFSKLSAGRTIRLLNSKVDAGVDECIVSFGDVISQHIVLKSVAELLPAASIVGVVPFHKPTIYLFPGGDGVSAVFGVRGLTLLIDGGYSQKTSSWQFVRHLDRVDAMLISHLGVENLFGVMSLINRISVGNDVLTSFGPVYFNAGPLSSSKSSSTADPLLLCLSDVGSSLVEKLHKNDISVLHCAANANAQPVNLYFKIGFGSVDMYILNPAESGGASSRTSRGGNVDESCVASVVVFRPAAHGAKPIRVLLPASLSYSKLSEGLDRLKNVTLFQTEDGLSKVVDRPKTGPAAAKPAGGLVPVSTSKTVRSSHDSNGASSKTHHEASTAPKPDAKETKKPAAVSAPDATQKDRKPVGSAASTTTASLADAKKVASKSLKESKTAAATANGKKPDVKETKQLAPAATSTPKKDSPRPATTHSQADAGKLAGGAKKPDDKKKKSVESDKLGKKLPETKPSAESNEGAVTVATVDNIQLVEKSPADESTAVGEVDSGRSVEPDSDGATSNGVEPQLAEPERSGAIEEPSTDGRIVDEIQGLPEPTVDPISDWGEPLGLPSPADVETVAPVESDLSVVGGIGSESDSVNTNLNQSDQVPVPDFGTENLEAPSDQNAADSKVNASDAEPPAGQNTAGTDPVVRGPEPSASTEPAMKKPLGTKTTGKQPTGKPSAGHGNLAEKSGGETARSSAAASGAGKKPVGKPAPTTDSKLVSKPVAAKEPIVSKLEPGKSSTVQQPHSAPAARKSTVPVKPVTPFYVDLAYIPLNISSAEFFNRVRSKYYVLPGVIASTNVLTRLLEAKASWEKDEITLIPTGDTENLVQWMHEHHDQLTSLHITITPSVLSCTMSLEQATSCTAYRIEL